MQQDITPATDNWGKACYESGIDFHADQVHHFVGGFSEGINGAWLPSTGQNVRDYFKDNPKDKALTNAAYEIGRNFAKDSETLLIVDIGDKR